MNRRRYLHQLAVLGLGATAAPILRADGPVPSGTSRMKQGSLSRVSPEQLLLWDPEVIVTQDAGFLHSASAPIRSGAISVPCAREGSTAHLRCPLAGWTAHPASTG